MALQNRSCHLAILRVHGERHNSHSRTISNGEGKNDDFRKTWFGNSIIHGRYTQCKFLALSYIAQTQSDN